jgi:hypothetical protein
VALFRGRAAAAALYGLALPLNLLPHLPGVTLLHARRAVLGGVGVPVQADGDPAGELPVVVEDAPAPLDVVVG